MKTQALSRRNGAATDGPTPRTIEVHHMCGHAETYTLLETGIAADIQEHLLRNIDCAKCALESLLDDHDLEIDEDHVPYLPFLLGDDSITDNAGTTARALALNEYLWFLTDVDSDRLMRTLAGHNLNWSYQERLRELINEKRPGVWMTVYELGTHQYVMEHLKLDPGLD